MSHLQDLAAALGIIRKHLPGWTVSRPPESETITVTSPRGVVFLDGERFWTSSMAESTVAELRGLGYDEDRERLRHRPAPRPESDTTPTFVEPTTTTAQPEPVKDPEPVAPRKAKYDKFIYPTEPQILTLDELLPPEGGDDDGQRYLIPTVIIDAEIAQAFADRAVDEHNRKPRKSNVRYFKRLMRSEKLLETHQGIAFNSLGELTDGRHRMLALCEIAQGDENEDANPDATITVDITYNMPVKTAFAYDGGAKRTSAEHAQVAGIDNASVVARLCNNLHKHLQTAGTSANWKDVKPLLPDEIVKLAEEHGDGLMEAWEGVRPLKRVKGLNINAAALFYYLAKQAWADAPVDDFVKGLANMEWSYEDDARRTLYRWATHSVERRIDIRHHLGNIMATYNDYCMEQPRQINKWLPKWGIPTPYVPDATKPRRRARNLASARKR